MPTTHDRPFRSAVILLVGGIFACTLLGGGLLGASAVGAQESAQVLSNHSGTGPGPSGPQEARSAKENERLYQSLKGYLMSPYCPGLTLGACGSGAAELLRLDMREWVDAGYTREAIVGYYARTFGEEFLGRPPFRGSAIVVWLAPIAAVLLGLVGIGIWLKRAAPQNATEMVDPGPVRELPSQDIDPETEARLEAEVRARYS